MHMRKVHIPVSSAAPTGTDRIALTKLGPRSKSNSESIEDLLQSSLETDVYKWAIKMLHQNICICQIDMREKGREEGKAGEKKKKKKGYSCSSNTRIIIIARRRGAFVDWQRGSR